MKKFKLLLLDTNIVIKAFELGLWQNLTERGSSIFSLSLSFWLTPTTLNNDGSASIIQALEFTMNKWSEGKRYEFALQWRNVGNGAGPGWRYWDPNQPAAERWVDLGLIDRLAGNQWHSLILQGEIVACQVHYTRFRIDQRWHSLDITVAPAVATGEPDRMAIAVQLDGNSTELPYSVFLDKIAFATRWAASCGDGRIDSIVDNMEDSTSWNHIFSDRDRATVSLNSIPGCRGQAIAINYNLNGPYPGGAGWLIVQRQLEQSQDLSGFTHLRFALQGSNANAHHNIQIKLYDRDGRVNWFVWESVADLPVLRGQIM
jgi:hypothetical protein